MAGFNDLPSPRDGIYDCVCGRRVQFFQQEPFMRQGVCRIVQGADQVKGYGLARDSWSLIKGFQSVTL